jgi:hypothetical protein
MTIATGIGIGAKVAQSAIRSAALAYPPLFHTRYFSDSKGLPLTFEQFHLDMMEAIDDDTMKRVLILVPADHAKTTIARFSLTRKAVRDRNIRMMNIMNNATDAIQNLVAIERELEDKKSLLYEDFGDLRGDLWQTTQFNIAGRTIKDKEPTLAAYGTGSNVFGHRSDFVLCDDLLNLENSGPQVTDETRRALHDWFFQGVLKVAGADGKVVVIGTVMDFRDLYHELGDLNNPAHRGQTHWYHPKHGFHVIRMKALIDEEQETVLWPALNPFSFLVAERESDLTAFMKRYQNEAIESAQLTFAEDRARMCLNRSRGWGEITQQMRDEGATRVYVTFDPSAKRGSKTSYPAVCIGAFNPNAEPPRKFYILELFRHPALLEETAENIALGRLGQTDVLMERYEHYNAAKLVIEENNHGAYVSQTTRFRAWAPGHIVVPHQTGANKNDPEIGVASMASIANALLFDFPYGDAQSRTAMDDFFAKELLPHPMGQTTDRIMALWFFVLHASASAEPRFKVVKRMLPRWAQGAGVRPQAKPMVRV